MADIDALYALPDISFIDNLSLEEVKEKAISIYEEEYEKVTGKKITLADADPDRLKLMAVSYLIYQCMQNIDKMGKMQLNKYAYGPYLKHLAAWKQVHEIEQESAITTQRFYVQTPKNNIISIPVGTRVTGDYNLFFETTEYAEIDIGNTYVDVNVVCTQKGKEGNGFEKGYLNIIVDPIPYIYKTENLEETQGGTDEESDESLRERCYDAPGNYSTAGAELSYISRVKSFSTKIIDQKVISPAPDCIDIYVLLENGELPNETFLEELEEYIKDRNRKTLNDKVTVKVPEQVEYDIELTYFISTEKAKQAVNIQKQVDKAINDYIVWQKSKIGRDKDLGELNSMIRAAGAKRTVITSDIYMKLEENQVAKLRTKAITYGGLEDD